MVLATPNSRKVAGTLLGLVLSCTLPLQAQTNTAPGAPSGAATTPGGLSGATSSGSGHAPPQYQQTPNKAVTAWQLARTRFDQADTARDNSHRAALAQEGMAASRQALSLDPNSAPAHYYLGLNMGELARTETLGALKLVRQMEREFLKARSLDPYFDYAGPDRCLGLLYRDAPSFGSIGDRTKALQHLQRALQLAPHDPENRLNLVESYLKWGEDDKAQQQLTALENLLPAARTQFSGPAWEASWADWNTRLEAVQRKLGQSGRR